jgi:Xaa-Pro aminopeptidase
VEGIVGPGTSVRRLGVAGGSLLDAGTATALRHALPDAEWVDVEPGLCRLRAVKTPAEIAVIRHAYRLAEAGLAVIRTDVVDDVRG